MEQLARPKSNRRHYGYFICMTCNKYWESSCAWPNVAQRCRFCGLAVYPYRLVALKRSRRKNRGGNGRGRRGGGMV